MDDRLLSTLSSLITHARIPKVSDFVHKDQCFYSFDTPESPLGIFVNLFTFFSYGYNFVKLYYERTGYRLYLNIRSTRTENKDTTLIDFSGDTIKPTKMGLGIEGGFHSSKDGYTISKIYYLVLLPEFIYIPYSSELPSPIYGSMLAIIESNHELHQNSFESWEQQLFVSKHSATLIQLNQVEKIPPSGWKCSKCEMTSNLWLNLTDGLILCGRKQFDGSGGNNHAVENYSITKYPLAVKLGTITPNGGDVYSYDEDDMVIDSNLSIHLAHFGINIAVMHKTDKTMEELQIDLNIQIGEASLIQESDSKLEPLYGSGFTGLNNLGNSCYINSVLQVLFSIPTFIDFFFKDVDYFSLFVENDLTNNVIFQLKKVARGLYHRNVSPNLENFIAPLQLNKDVLEQELVDFSNFPITPSHLRNVVGRGHREFSSSKQQDAQEYLLHILNTIDKNITSSDINPCDIFRFTIQDRLECLQSHHVQYSTRIESVLTLSIPRSIHCDENKTHDPELTSSKESDQRKDNNLSFSKIKVSIVECFENFQAPHIISEFISPVTNTLGSAAKSSTLKTFPQYLFVHFGKFYVGEDWIPKKLDVEISGTEKIIDLEFLRSQPIPNNETIISDEEPKLNHELLVQLLEFGCEEALAKQALKMFNNDFDSALSWVLNPDLPVILQDLPNIPSEPDTSLIESMMDFGFNHDQSVYALKKTSNNVERAIDYLFSHSEEISSLMSSQNLPRINLSDGIAHYQLISIISHIGSSTLCGHYVAHIYKDDRWILFNDEKVTESKNPPFKFGYLYLYISDILNTMDNTTKMLLIHI